MTNMLITLLRLSPAETLAFFFRLRYSLNYSVILRCNIIAKKIAIGIVSCTGQ